jgi:hypothetical protein
VTRPKAASSLLGEFREGCLAARPRLALAIKTELVLFRRINACEADFDTPDFHSIAVMDVRDAR